MFGPCWHFLGTQASYFSWTDRVLSTKMIYIMSKGKVFLLRSIWGGKSECKAEKIEETDQELEEEKKKARG